MTVNRTETVQVEINGFSFDADCNFDFDEGVAAYLDGLPEDCHPEEPAEIAPIKLMVYFDKKEKPKDMSDLLEFEVINEDIADQLNDIIEAKGNDW